MENALKIASPQGPALHVPADIVAGSKGPDLHEGRHLWVTWERHRRTRELSRALDTELFEITSGLPRVARYLTLLARTTIRVARDTPSLLVIQCPSLVLGVWAVALKYVFGFTLVADLHNEAVRPYIVSSRIYERLLRVVHRGADLCIVSNPNLTSVIEQAGGRAFVLPDKLPDLAPTRTTPAAPEAARVVFVCTFSRDEPYLEVIEAARELDPSVTVYVTGRLRGTAPPAPGNVQFTNFLPEAEYVQLLASADLVVDLTAIEDCLVCGAYEAVALGRPLVTSDTAALRQYFRLGTIYTRHDRRSLAAAIAEALAHKERLASEMQMLKPELAREWTGQKDALRHWLQRDDRTGARVTG
jgi:glycosyltransferase involved in cell wall biosynthesis